jgi:hypothetical protein
VEALSTTTISTGTPRWLSTASRQRPMYRALLNVTMATETDGFGMSIGVCYKDPQWSIPTTPASGVPENIS